DFVREHKGREPPGTFNPLLIGEVFIRNSKPWETLAKSHVEDSWNAAKDFVNDLLDDIADRTVGDAILRRIIKPAMEERLQALYTKIDELMKPFKRAYPMTHNPLFVSKIQFLKKQRAEEEAANGQGSPFVGDLESMYDYACSELLDCMLAYYDVALHVFVDNVTSLAVENCLLGGLEDLLSPYRVAAMADDELQELAAEAKDVREFREREQERRRVLDSGLATCHRYVKRKRRHFPSSASSTNAKTSPGSSNGQTSGNVLSSRPKAQPHSNSIFFGPVPSTTSRNASWPGLFSNLGAPSNNDSAFGSSGATANKPQSSGSSIFTGAST
ncbi:MAG: hypothetical protein M1835_007479, partial [Candelina submexicana]